MRPVFASATGAPSTTTPSAVGWKAAPSPLPQAAQAYAAVSEPDQSFAPGAKIQSRLASPEPMAMAKEAGRSEPAKAEPVRYEPVKAEPVKAETKAEATERREALRAAVTAWVIQLGATDDETKAKEILEQARSRSGRMLAKASAFTEKVVREGTTLYRARFSGFQEADSAQQACKTLKRSGFNCFATRS
jgi:D-alanyl-D-alanine carboxypeptidase